MLPPDPVSAGPGQESVWEYPRPPRLERVGDRLRVVHGGKVIADSKQGYRVLETSHPPVYYLPPCDVRVEFLIPATGRTFCEFKGYASYWSIDVHGHRATAAAWSYPAPRKRFLPIRNYFAFYASKVDECRVGDERVTAQAGDFYGGWITSRVAGPFKGGPGSAGW